MSLRHLRRVLQERLYDISGWWISKKEATILVTLLKDIPIKLIEELVKDAETGRIKPFQHPNYYKQILWRRLQDYLAKPIPTEYARLYGVKSVAEIVGRIFDVEKAKRITEKENNPPA